MSKPNSSLLGPKKIGVKHFLGGPNIFLHLKKIVGPNFGNKKNWVGGGGAKIFCVEKLLGLKKKNSWGKKIFGHKKFLGKNIFWGA